MLDFLSLALSKKGSGQSGGGEGGPATDTLTEFIRLRGGDALFRLSMTNTADMHKDIEYFFRTIDGSILTNTSAMFHSVRHNFSSAPLFDTSNVTNMTSMFDTCIGLTTVPLYNTSNVTSMNSMFNGCTSLTTVPQFDTSNVTTMSSMFYNCSNLTTVPQFDTNNVTKINSIFSGCKALTTVPLFDTNNVTTMSSMFNNCSNLTTVPQFDTSNVTDMSSMFIYCGKLTTVPLFDTSNVTNMGYMFGYCEALTTVPSFDTSNVTNMSGMFNSCKALTEIWIKNIKTALTVGSGDGTSSSHYGHLLTVDSLVHLCYELRDTGRSRTLTVGTANLAKLADVYVKLVDITDEMRAEDDLIDEKLPFVRCESTDEGAILISDYLPAKNWELK